MENSRFLEDVNPLDPKRPFTPKDEEHRKLIGDSIRCSKLLSNRMQLLESTLIAERSLLKGLMSRLRQVFRNDKGFKDLLLLVKALDRWIELKYASAAETLYSSFPTAFTIQNKNSFILPSSSYVLNFLTRSYQSALLLEKIRDVYCINAGESCFMRLRLGHFWKMALYWLSVVAKVSSAIDPSLISLIKDSYDEIRRFYSIVQEKKLIEGLPTRFGDGSSKLETIQTIAQNNGEVISRVDFIPPEKAKRCRILSKRFCKFKKREDVMTWIKEETAQRKENRKKALTKPLTAEEWKDYKKKVKVKEGLSVSEAEDLLFLYVLYPEMGMLDKKPAKWLIIKKNVLSKTHPSQ